MNDILDLDGWAVLSKKLVDDELEIEAEYTGQPDACQKCGVIAPHTFFRGAQQFKGEIMETKQQPATLLPSYETLMAQAQVFASAWAIAGSRFDSGDGMEVANQEKSILADMFRRLHAENEQLRAGYDAARLEIASLQAQLEAVGAGGVEPLRKRCLHQISEPAQAQAQPVVAAPWQPIATAPEGNPVVVCWLDAEDVEHPERHEFDCLEDGVWQKHDDNYQHFFAVAPPGSCGPRELPPYTHWMPLTSPQDGATTPQPAARALDSVRVFWQQHTQADALSMTMAELHDDVELVIRASRRQTTAGANMAAPVDAAVQRESQYNRGFRHGYNRRDAEVKGALA